MHNFELIEEYYRQYSTQLEYWLPDGISVVNLDLLHHLDLLHFAPLEQHSSHNQILDSYFEIAESSDKLTLVNDEFIIWIYPDNESNVPKTFTMIALNDSEGPPQLEVAFMASGVYNNSNLIMQILEKFLFETQENQYLIERYEKSS